MTFAQRSLLVLSACTLAACALPDAKVADEKSYEEPAVVTGSRVPRKTPAGVQSIDGDSIRAQGQIAPGRGVTGQRGQQ